MADYHTARAGFVRTRADSICHKARNHVDNAQKHTQAVGWQNQRCENATGEVIVHEQSEQGEQTVNIPIKIYHIVHCANLPSIINDGYIFSDAEMRKRSDNAVIIGMNRIKDRRLTLPLTSHHGLHVGECVPFYFCPRSPMLYMFHMRNSPDIAYRDGQQPIIHLVADLQKTAAWADKNNLRWAFTDSNAGSRYFEDYTSIADIGKVDWESVNTTNWSGRQDKKQAEFLIEHRFPWELIDEIGVYSHQQLGQLQHIIGQQDLPIKVQRTWYY